MSYSRKDSRFVLQLVNELQLLGADLFVDQQGIGGGERWNQVLEDELRKSKGVLLALSPRSVASEFVRREQSIALKNKIPIFPLLIAKTTIPEDLRHLEYIDFTKSHADALSRTLKALELDKPHSMQRIYVSHDLDEKSAELKEVIAQILRAHAIDAVSERRSLAVATAERQLATLKACDGLLSILSEPADAKSLEQIKAELQHCDGTGKRNLVIPYSGIHMPSLWQGRELLTYSRRREVDFAIKLSSQIAAWKHQLGKVVKAQLQLKGRGDRLSPSARVQYRTFSEGRTSNWADTRLIHEAGGFTAFLSGVRDNQFIEVRVEDGSTIWNSPFSPQVLFLQLDRIED